MIAEAGERQRQAHFTQMSIEAEWFRAGARPHAHWSRTWRRHTSGFGDPVARSDRLACAAHAAPRRGARQVRRTSAPHGAEIHSLRATPRGVADRHQLPFAGSSGTVKYIPHTDELEWRIADFTKSSNCSIFLLFLASDRMPSLRNGARIPTQEDDYSQPNVTAIFGCLAETLARNNPAAHARNFSGARDTTLLNARV